MQTSLSKIVPKGSPQIGTKIKVLS